MAGEKSWGGFEIHTEAGFNIGKPCYGYRARRVPHPVPAKRAKGMKKTRLEAHPAEGSVARTMFHWRVTERIGYQAIADRLNQDLETNPPPVPVDPGTAVGRWTYSNVREVLTNPKHTGHMVWNRRARKGAGKNRMNPVTEWVWSPEPVHEALVDLETFVQPQDVAIRRERSRTAAALSPDPQARRHEQASKAEALRRAIAIADTDAKSRRLIRNLELTDDLDQDFIRDVKERRAELRAHRTGLERQLAAAEEQAPPGP
jgi:Recombinase